MAVLKIGDNSDDVARLQALLCLADFDAKPIDGAFGNGTARATRACQAANGLTQSGEADEATGARIGMDKPDGTKTLRPVVGAVTVEAVVDMFPSATPRANIETHLPFVLGAMREAGMDDRELVLMALATIRAESEGFVPIDEGISRFNTSPGGAPFDLYDAGTSIGGRLGNTHAGDGARFKGRGFIQLTGRHNYETLGPKIGLGDRLGKEPELANDPKIAARILAAFLKAKEARIKYAILGRDLKQARKLVNGGSHGLDRFTETFETGAQVLAA